MLISNFRKIWQRGIAPLLMILSLYGCGGGGEVESPTIQTTPKTITISLVNNADLYAGLSTQLKATLTEANGQSSDISSSASWVSGDSRIATVGASGLVTAHKAGSVNIQANFEGLSTKQTIVVLPAKQAKLKKIEIAGLVNVTINSPIQLHAIGFFDDGSSADISAKVNWSTNDLTIATINSTGLLTTYKTGSVNIRADLDGMSMVLQKVNVVPEKPTTPPKLSAILVDPFNDLTINSQLQLIAIGIFDDGSRSDISRKVSWSSSNSDVASISLTGLLTARNAGTAFIQATLDGVTTQRPLNVVAAPATKLTTIELASIADLAVDTSLQLSAIGVFADGSRSDISGKVSWSSSNNDVASISSTGLLTAQNVGAAFIQASLDGVTTQQPLNVVAASEAKLTAIELEGIADVNVDTTLMLSAMGLFDDGSRSDISRKVSWSSSNNSIASISATGLLTALTVGSTVVQATLDGVVIRQTLNVVDTSAVKLTTIELAGIADLAVDNSLQLSVMGLYDDGSRIDISGKVNWSSSNPRIASISATGLLTTLNIGSTVIQASLDGVTIQRALNVVAASTAKLTTIEVASIADLTVDISLQLSAMGIFDDGNRSDISSQVSWSSSNNSIASISATGLLTARQQGSAVIVATLDGVTTQQTVNVMAANQPPKISGTPDAASVGLPFRFAPTMTDADGDTIVFSAANLPAWLKLNAQQKILSGVPQAGDLGEHKLTLIANDGRNSTSFDVTITVDSGDRYDLVNAQDFYAVDINNQPRKLVNHLTGQFAAHVQFVQSHSIFASGNTKRDTTNELNSRYMPNLVPERSALMMVIPEQELSSLTAVISVEGTEILRLAMKHPNALLRSDYNARDGRDDVIYSTKAWSIEVPWHAMVPGISVTFIADAKTATEQFAELSKFEFGAPSEMVLRSIRLGMLAEPPVSNNHQMLIKTAKAGTDYFQTIPIAKLIMVNYQTMKLDKVIISNGTIYDQVSKSEGSVYAGDMRADVAKAQVSTGINLANVGITSNNMFQSYPHVIKQITMHHAAGNYANGVHSHGLSGGNGIATLYSSIGNELSHELGHAYGVGHFPGANLTPDKKWAAHHADSGWGYIAHRQRMRANLHWHWAGTGASIDGYTSPYTFKNIYSYNRDAMSGGENPTLADLSGYTHHTGYSALIIQKNLDMPIADPTFPSGYKKWNSTSLRFVDYPNLGDARILKPTKVGTQVTTLLGGYDPEKGVALIYPTFEGNYGNLFNLPEPVSTGNACWLEVNNASGELKKIALAATRYNKNSINQFHVNLPATYLPTEAALYCRIAGTTTTLATQQFSGTRAPMADAILIGKEHGFDALKAEELPLISSELEKLANQTVPVANPTLTILLASYPTETLQANISAAARQVLDTLQANNTKANNVKRLINRVVSNGNEPQDKRLAVDWLKEQQLVNADNTLPTPASLLMLNSTSVCVTSELVDGKVTIVKQCPRETKALQWFMDARGAIHPTAKPDLCLMPGSADSLVLKDCDLNLTTQRWASDTGRLKNLGNNRCLDHGKGTVVMYGCHTGSNQQWKKLEGTNNMLLSLLNGSTIRSLLTLLH